MRAFSLFALLAITATSASAQDIPGTAISYGSWSGGAYVLEDGSFSHCSVAAEYVHGNTLAFSVNVDATVSVGVVAPTDTFIENENFPVALFVDRRSPFYGDVSAVDATVRTYKSA